MQNRKDKGVLECSSRAPFCVYGFREREVRACAHSEGWACAMRQNKNFFVTENGLLSLKGEYEYAEYKTNKILLLFRLSNSVVMSKMIPFIIVQYKIRQEIDYSLIRAMKFYTEKVNSTPVTSCGETHLCIYDTGY